MRRDVKKIIIHSLVAFLVTVFVAIVIYQTNAYLKLQKNNADAEELVNNGLTYNEDALEDELGEIEEILSRKYLSSANKGKLYERESLLYQNLNDTVDYYRTVGKAIYYLNDGGEKDTAFNLYADLASYYIFHGSNEHAAEVLDDAYEVEPIEEISSLQIQSYAYRLRGVLKEREGDYEGAEEDILKAEELVAAANGEGWEFAYHPIDEANLAKIYFDQGRYEEAQEIIDSYEDSEYYHPTMYADSMATGFILPMSLTKVCLAVSKNSSTEVQSALREYVGYCQSYGYAKEALDGIFYVSRNMELKTGTLSSYIENMTDRLYNEINDKQSEEYIALIQSQLDVSIADAGEQEDEISALQARMVTYIIYLIFVFVVLALWGLAVANARVDGLTKVKNRRSFNSAVLKLQNANVRYAALMIDIDNFKHINDTYGHLAGDRVLMRIGVILNRMTNSEIEVYRYGGEEFVICCKGRAVESASMVGESVRRLVESETWDFGETITVSIGIATGSGSEDVVKKADEKMYESKSKGKNCVTF